jgi:hypothetical protein
MEIPLPLSVYQAFAPAVLQMLNSLATLLDKAAAHARAKGIDPKQLIEARLAPDMLPFVAQVRIATDHAKGMTARLSGRENPKYQDDETTFDELKARLAKTIAFVKSVPAAEFEGAEDREVTVTLRSGPLTLSGQRYLAHFALPNFYFHVTTAYDILRHNGLEIGKRDFIGSY